MERFSVSRSRRDNRLLNLPNSVLGFKHFKHAYLDSDKGSSLYVSAVSLDSEGVWGDCSPATMMSISGGSRVDFRRGLRRRSVS